MEAIVKDVMTTHVVAVTRNGSFKEMALGLREFRVSAYPRTSYPIVTGPASR